MYLTEEELAYGISSLKKKIEPEKIEKGIKDLHVAKEENRLYLHHLKEEKIGVVEFFKRKRLS